MLQRLREYTSVHTRPRLRSAVGQLVTWVRNTTMGLLCMTGVAFAQEWVGWSSPDYAWITPVPGVSKSADFCKNWKSSVGWDCVAEKVVQTVNSVTAPRGDYSHKYATMADGKGNTPSTGMDALFSGGENCRFELGVQKCEKPSALKQLMESGSGDYDAALRRYQAETQVVADNTANATLQQFPNIPKPVSNLSPLGRRLQSGLDKFGRIAQEAATSQQKSQDVPGRPSDISANGPGSSIFPTTMAPETIDLGDGMRAHVGGEYNTRLGAIARGDIMSMFGPNLGISLGGSIGSEQREKLIKVGWQIDKDNMIKLTYQDLQQLLDYSFRSGDESVWMTQRTLGATWRFNPNHDWIKYMEVNGFISKSDSKALASTNVEVSSATLYELYKEHRRVGGVTSYGGSVAANFEVTRNDTITVTLGAERKRIDLDPTFENPAGVKPLQMRVIWSAEYRHDWGSLQEGGQDRLSTGVKFERNSTGYNVDADVQYQVDGNKSLRAFVRHDILPGNDMGLAGGGDNTTIGIGGKITFGATDPARKPAYETRSDADPVGIDRFISRGADQARDVAQRDVNDNVPPKIGALLDFLSERATFERTQVEGYAQTRRERLESVQLTNDMQVVNGTIEKTAVFVLGAVVSAVNTTSGANIPTSVFSTNGSKFSFKASDLLPYVRSNSSAASPDTITVTTTNGVVTIVAHHGSIIIQSITPTESGSINDTTPPLTTSAPSVSSTTSSGTTLSAKISEAGTGYYLVQAANLAAPSAATVRDSGTSFAMSANTATSVNITGLSASTAYKVYFVAKDTRNNLQTSVGSASFTTEAVADVTGPQLLTEIGGGPSQTGQEFDMAFNFNEPVVDVSDIALTTGGTGFSYTLENGGNRVRIKGVPTNEGDARVTFKVKDAANNPSNIISQGAYEVFAPAS